MPVHWLLGEAVQIGRETVGHAHIRPGNAGIGPPPRPRGIRRLPTGPRVVLRCHSCRIPPQQQLRYAPNNKKCFAQAAKKKFPFLDPSIGVKISSLHGNRSKPSQDLRGRKL